MNLGIERQVRAHGQGDSLAPSRILESPQLDDPAWRRVTGRVKVGQADMVGASIHAVDHGVGCSVELVVETARDQPPGDRPCGIPVSECEISHAAVDALLGEPAVDTPDDVISLP
jgi:hypothetical protein